MRRFEISIVNDCKASRIDKNPFKRFLRELGGRMGIEADQVSVLFTDDPHMKKLNAKYRGRNMTTDVLSFPAGEKNLEGLTNMGDIVISIPAAVSQAKMAGWPLEMEIKKLLTHGFLHLAGYDHETDRGEMRRMEEKYFNELIAMKSSRSRKRKGGCRTG
ncbi:MAG: rRNA maturation RNase YbeY [Acidobacteriota bacterium]